MARIKLIKFMSAYGAIEVIELVNTACFCSIRVSNYSRIIDFGFINEFLNNPLNKSDSLSLSQEANILKIDSLITSLGA